MQGNFGGTPDINSLGLGAAIPNFDNPALSNMQFESTGMPGVFELKKNAGGQNVTFYTKEFYNKYKTEQAKQAAEAKGETGPIVPVYDKREMVKIENPGDTNKYDSFAEDDHKRNYFDIYKNFRDGKGALRGTPLAEAEFIHQVELVELNYRGVFTIEQLAQAPDILCDQIPFCYDRREAAKAWCKFTHGAQLINATKKLSADLSEALATITKLSKENEEAAKRLAALEQNAMFEREVRAQTIAEESAPKNKGGRPRKVVEAEETLETAQNE